ncbi:Subunit of heteropentameric Replication factor C (RF-C) [Cystobasidiomycetes sp. EMM_F5]
MSVSDEEMLSGSDVEREMADAEVQRSAKGKAKEVLLADGAAPAPLPGAQAAHTLDNLPWVEKYRPVTLDDVVSHADITSTIDKFLELNQLPHMLFYGPPGTGKTSTVLCIARKIYGDPGKSKSASNAYRNNVLELNASDERGIDVVREQIKNFAGVRTFGSSAYKLIILDEADMMTQVAQGALRRGETSSSALQRLLVLTVYPTVIEQYTKNVRFCIICNYVNRIIPAIQSRCTRFRFGPLPIIEVERRLHTVIDAEKVQLTPDGKQALLRLSKGDMRRALNVMQDDDTNACLALQDVIAGIYDFVATVKFPPATRIYILDHLAQVEHRLSTGGNEKLQLTSLLATFKNGVEIAAR